MSSTGVSWKSTLKSSDSLPFNILDGQDGIDVEEKVLLSPERYAKLADAFDDYECSKSKASSSSNIIVVSDSLSNEVGGKEKDLPIKMLFDIKEEEGSEAPLRRGRPRQFSKAEQRAKNTKAVQLYRRKKAIEQRERDEELLRVTNENRMLLKEKWDLMRKNKKLLRELNALRCRIELAKK